MLSTSHRNPIFKHTHKSFLVHHHQQQPVLLIHSCIQMYRSQNRHSFKLQRRLILQRYKLGSNFSKTAKSTLVLVVAQLEPLTGGQSIEKYKTCHFDSNEKRKKRITNQKTLLPPFSSSIWVMNDETSKSLTFLFSYCKPKTKLVIFLFMINLQAIIYAHIRTLFESTDWILSWRFIMIQLSCLAPIRKTIFSIGN